MLLVILLIFIVLFFMLFVLKEPFFKNKKLWLRIDLGIIFIITLIQIIISGLGLTTAFILFWVAASCLFYYVYNKYNQKVGFIMVNFSLFFSVVFLFLQVWIFGIN